MKNDRGDRCSMQRVREIKGLVGARVRDSNRERFEDPSIQINLCIKKRITWMRSRYRRIPTWNGGVSLRRQMSAIPWRGTETAKMMWPTIKYRFSSDSERKTIIQRLCIVRRNEQLSRNISQMFTKQVVFLLFPQSIIDVFVTEATLLFNCYYECGKG